MTLSQEHRRKLVALLGQLGHDNEHIRASAGLAADRLIRTTGITWEAVIAAQAAQAAQTMPEREVAETVGGTYLHEEFASILAHALQSASNEWEIKFVSGLKEKFATFGVRTFLSSKQRTILERIVGESK